MLARSVFRRCYASKAPLSVTHSLDFFDRIHPHTIPAFQVLDGRGSIIDAVPDTIKHQARSLDHDLLLKMYRNMLMLPILDNILYNVQRQGRISFYMTSHGEEAAVTCSAAAWNPTDEVFAQYRESGVLIWRGMPLADMLAQCFGTYKDTSTKGRQMPIHYGSATHHFHTISSPLGTQIPQAAGAAYALKRTKEMGKGRENDCVVCYFGEGAASEGDFHAGLNMASVLQVPIVFFVRNNGFAISTPSAQQFKGDGIASRGPGYGIDTIRVDGNDPLATYIASKEARRRAVEESKAVMVEAMSYRVGHHSTSDDSFAYRSKSDVAAASLTSPLLRMNAYLTSLGLWSEDLEVSTKAEHKKTVMAAFAEAEKDKKGSLKEMFGDVYAEEGRLQREQREEVKRLVEKWGSVDEGWKSELKKFHGEGKDL